MGLYRAVIWAARFSFASLTENACYSIRKLEGKCQLHVIMVRRCS